MIKLNAVNQRRLDVFKRNRRAVYSLFLCTALFILSLFAEVIANDKPLLIQFDSSFYTPIFSSYSETDFGGDFDTEADYTDPYLVELIESQGWMLWPPIRYHYSTHITELNHSAPSPPSGNNILGTDDQARDVFARALYGFRTSMLFALCLTFLTSLIGITIGACQGYYGGAIDLIGQRFIEIWGGLPSLFLLIILAGIVTPNFWWLLLLLTLFSWTQLVDVVRAEFLRARNLDYVQAARVIGCSDTRIIFKHILPNGLVATMSLMPFILAGAISSLTALDFLGFGLPPGSASLGELVAQGKSNLHAPWLGITAFVVLSSILILLVFIGEGLRDAFDPRLLEDV